MKINFFFTLKLSLCYFFKILSFPHLFFNTTLKIKKGKINKLMNMLFCKKYVYKLSLLACLIYINLLLSFIF
jgi:hypothetical protein